MQIEIKTSDYIRCETCNTNRFAVAEIYHPMETCLIIACLHCGAALHTTLVDDGLPGVPDSVDVKTIPNPINGANKNGPSSHQHKKFGTM